MDDTGNQPRILILAAQRHGRLDPLAREAGVTHKCLVPVLGVPMISRVLATIEEAFPHAPIFISIEDPEVLATEKSVQRLRAQGRLSFVAAAFNLVDSVKAAASAVGYPLLVTTGDNVLTSVEALQAMAKAGQNGEAGAIAVMARKEAIQAAHPGGKGRYYEFRDGGFSNCNLFWIGDEQAVSAAEAFREGGQFLKVKGRIMKAFGLVNLILFKLKALSLKQTFASVSSRLGVKVQPLVLEDGRLAIDVDDERSLRMTEDILRRDAGERAAA